MKSCNGTYFVNVFAAPATHEIIDSDTLITERKFIREVRAGRGANRMCREWGCEEIWKGCA